MNQEKQGVNNTSRQENALSNEERDLRMAQLRNELNKAEQRGDEQKVLVIEAEIRALEEGVNFDLEATEKTINAALLEREEKAYEESKEGAFYSNVFTYVKGICEYLHHEKISNIILIDRAARPTWVGIHEYWKHTFPENKLPSFYFVNPSGFLDVKSFFELKDPRSQEYVRNTGDIDKEFANTYKQLMLEKEKPMVLFDTCAHTGSTLKSVETTLKRLGFIDVRIITARVPDEESVCKSELIFDDKKHAHTCYPFGVEQSVSTNHASVVSEALDDIFGTSLFEGLRLRKKIRSFIRKKLGVIN